MDREDLHRYFEKNYLSKRDMLSRIPLGMDPEKFWQEIQNNRKRKSQLLPLRGLNGNILWFVTTDKMITASEQIVEELLNLEAEPNGLPMLAPLEEAFYTSFVEGSPMTMQAAMEYLQSGDTPKDIEEQMVENNRRAMALAANNLYYPMNENFIKELAGILTENMDGGGRKYRSSDWVSVPSMMGEAYTLPTALSVPECMKELTEYLANPEVHPLIKAAVAQACILMIQPFSEGNERLARILSNVILIRAGYTFFGDISISGLIAKNGYPYYNAMESILRKESDGDLTYLIEYYLTLLAQAVLDKRKRKQDEEARSLLAEQELAKTKLAGPPVTPSPQGPDTTPHGPTTSESIKDHEPEAADTESWVESQPGRDDVTQSLAADGFVNLADLGREAKMLAVDKDGVPWIGEQIVRDALASVSAGTSAVLPDFADALLGFMNRGQYIFTSKELENATGYPSSRVNKLISMMREKRILVNVGMTGVRANYTFGNCGVDLKECYDSTVIGTIQELTGAVYSAKDRRMGIALENGLTLGTVTQDDYEKMGEGDKWDSDMKLAEQMGIVRRISKECCQILQNVRPRLDQLDVYQKRRARKLYEAFGKDPFSIEMYAATIEISNSTASAYLHHFRLLQILDCRREDVTMYQLRVNPEEYPEIFDEAA